MSKTNGKPDHKFELIIWMKGDISKEDAKVNLKLHLNNAYRNGEIADFDL
jgi:hypothetical protein